MPLPAKNVCFWHKADINDLRINVRFWRKADIASRSAGRAGSGRSAQALRKELKGTLADEGPREDQKNNCRRAIKR
jgi:hypothetical protein